MSAAKKYGLIPSVVGNAVIIDIDDTEAFLVRENADGGDIFVVDTVNGVVAIGGVTPVNGCRLVLPLENDEATPTLAFGDGDTGFFERSEDEIGVTISGSRNWSFITNTFASVNAAGPVLINQATTGSTPSIIPHRGDPDTGIGQSGSNVLSLITGGVGTYFINKSGRTRRWCTQETLSDGGKIDMIATTNGGIGFAQLGDGEEYALFSFTSAGVVTLITNSVNVTTVEDNDTTFNIFDSGTAIGFNNELGSSKNLFVMLWYS